MKEHAFANPLVEIPIDDDYKPLSTYFPDEEVSLNRGSSSGRQPSEYEACIMGLKMALNLDMHELLVMVDFDLLMRQVQGELETRDIKIIPYRQCVQDLSNIFKSIVFKYIPRFHNELADALATLALMLPYPGNIHIDPLEIQVGNQHGYYNTIGEEPDGEPWYHDIK
uniref:RNase H type-1 domain-containing protein n=1 Tax=Nicotiana tabacum TaxID=4097 RepID=A0A1S4A2N6_TOBAC|nr:PREDICTED: uncharacterized protein LOC107793089 [Nicotiana tabacum]